MEQLSEKKKSSIHMDLQQSTQKKKLTPIPPPEVPALFQNSVENQTNPPTHPPSPPPPPPRIVSTSHLAIPWPSALPSPPALL